MIYLGIFELEFENTIIIFEINIFQIFSAKLKILKSRTK